MTATGDAPPPTPLHGVRVLDLGQVLASPFAGYLLGMLGAEVIKVEPIDGEWLRQTGGWGFPTQNGGKRSLAIDLKSADGVDALLDVAAGCDVFLEGFAPGTAERLGIGFDAVRARRPTVVYASLSAFGAEGPYAGRPGFDHVVQAMSGIMASTGFPDGPPTKVGSPYLDFGTGLLLAFATLAGILEARRTGDAQHVDVAMLDLGLLLNASALVVAANTGRNPPRTGNDAFSGAAASGVYETADGLLALAANKRRHVERLGRELGLAELADHPDRARSSAPDADRDRIRAALREALQARSAAEWEERLDRAGVPAARVRALTDVVDEGHPDARGLLVDVETADGSTIRLPASGVRFGGVMPGPSGPAASLGADTRAVLAEAGVADDRIADLIDAGVILPDG